MVFKQRLRAAGFVVLATRCNQRVVALDVYRKAISRTRERSRLAKRADDEYWRSVVDALLRLE